MSNLIWKIRVPGKLMIAGEYAILEPKQHAIVIAVNRYITLEMKSSPENILSWPQLGFHQLTWKCEGNKVVYSRFDSRLIYFQQAIEVMNQYFRELSIPMGNFQIIIQSDLADNEGRKYGLGSSAAIVVGVVVSILSYNKIRLSPVEIFKLSALAHLKAQGNGSGADIAASIFGGWIHYIAYPANWVWNQLAKGTKISDLIKQPWPNLLITPLTAPSNLELCVGWTKEVARTGPMVEKIKKLRITNPYIYECFLQASYQAVASIAKGFETGNNRIVLEGISLNRQALRRLGELANVSIETTKLKTLCDEAEKFGKAKSSGAGGGDCGIAFIQHVNQKLRLHEDWIKEGIIPLNMNVSKTGLVVSELIKRNVLK